MTRSLHATLHVLAGYVWVRGNSQIDQPGVPRPFWSLSEWLCPVLPGVAGLSWTQRTAADDSELSENLGVAPDQLGNLRAWVDDQFDAGALRWPCVFTDLGVAEAFGHRYLARAPNAALLAVALPRHLVSALDRFEGQAAAGLVAGAQRLEEAPVQSWRARGYEVLGATPGGRFHSFVTNHLGEVFTRELGIPLNAQGLIESLADAERAARHAMRKDVGAEPAQWLPWLLADPRHAPHSPEQIP